MTAPLSIEVPFPVFQDRDGQPLENGYVWLGVANLNPQVNPVIAYFDKALTIVAPQPLRTLNGYISRAGTPAQVYVDGVNFSILVQDSKGSMVYNFPDANGLSPDACGVTYNPPFTGGVAIPVCEKLAQTVSVKDFGADSTGATSANVQIQAAIDYVASLGGGVVEFENGGTYLFSGQVLLKTNVSLRGNGCTVSVNPLNYTGGITQFFGVFTTVNITARPQSILFRIGTGVISFENIQIDGFTFLINRDGNVLTSGQMDVAEINIVRFEDARNCKLSNCKFIDGETFANNNGSTAVFLVRSEMCEISSCTTQDTTFVYIAECKQCVVADNILPVSVGTTIETVAGESHTIRNNRLGITYWVVSSIGINSRQCRIYGNVVEKAAISGITIGHPTVSGGPNVYNLPLDANFSTCRDNYISAGDNLTIDHGLRGILVQAASFITVSDNVILNLTKQTSYLDRPAGILVQPDSAASATGLRFERNRINGANNGINIVRGEAISIEDNSINDVFGGILYTLTDNNPRMTITGNFVNSAVRALSLESGRAEITGNFFSNITDATFSIALSRGYFRIENNFLSECGEIFLGNVKSVSVTGNVFENAVVKTRIGNLNNSNLAGTATINQITVFGNDHPGTTDGLRIVNVIGQSTRILENTVPVQFRTTSYNVGTLPTSSAGLSAGDLFNDTGTVKVV